MSTVKYKDQNGQWVEASTLTVKGDGPSSSVIIVDSALSDTSINPVQNKVVKKYIDDESVYLEGYAESMANNAEANAKKYTDEKIAQIGSGSGKIEEDLANVEEVWAASYNLLNQKISDVQQYIYDEAASRRQFDEAIAEIKSILLENEAVVTAAWNQLNIRINALEAAQARGE